MSRLRCSASMFEATDLMPWTSHQMLFQRDAWAAACWNPHLAAHSANPVTPVPQKLRGAEQDLGEEDHR